MAYVKHGAVKTNVLNVIDYVMNPKKTDEYALVSAHNCYPEAKLATNQMLNQRQKFGKDGGILVHHFKQSFKPGEVDPELAHQIGNEWAKKMFPGYQIIVSTHIDRAHIHNHIVVNSVHKFGNKYNACKESLREGRHISDQICLENELSIINTKKSREKNKSYKEWQEEKEKRSWKSIIKEDIDAAIAGANTFQDFLSIMKGNDYYIKHGQNVMHMVFKKKGMERGARGKTLGVNYTEEAIKARIALKEYAFNYSDIKLRRPRKNFSVVERQVFGLRHRHARMSTNLALAIHVMASAGNSRLSTVKKSTPQYKKYKTETGKQIDGIVKQLHYVKKNAIHSQSDLDGHIKKLVAKLDGMNYYIKSMDSLQEQTKSIYFQTKFILKGSDDTDRLTYLKGKFEKLGMEDEASYHQFISDYDHRQQEIKTAHADVKRIKAEIEQCHRIGERIDKIRDRDFSIVTDDRSNPTMEMKKVQMEKGKGGN